MNHHHVHDEKEKKAVINRIARIIGHMESVKRMVENDVDCAEVLTQLAAIKSAVNNTGKVVLKGHMEHCIVHAIEDHDLEAIKEFEESIDKFLK